MKSEAEKEGCSSFDIFASHMISHCWEPETISMLFVKQKQTKLEWILYEFFISV
jgi:hypothetical protein